MIGIYPLCRTSQGTHFVSIVKIKRFTMFGEIMIVYFDVHTEDINKMCALSWTGEEGEFLALEQVVCIITAGL